MPMPKGAKCSPRENRTIEKLKDKIEELEDRLEKVDDFEKSDFKARTILLLPETASLTYQAEESLIKQPDSIQITKHLDDLVNAGPNERRVHHKMLITYSNSDDIIRKAFLEFDRTGREDYLLQAVSVLESFGASAWATLETISNSKRPECELFVGLVARCKNIPDELKLQALINLSSNPSNFVRLSVLEHLPRSLKRQADGISLLEKLVQDPDPEVREEAHFRLGEARSDT